MKKLILPLLALCLAATATQADIRINEVHFNVEGPDGNYEFIELKSTTNGVEPLTDLSLVIINTALSEGSTVADPQYRNPGEIIEVLNLSELSTGANGLLLLGNGYTGSPPGGPWSGAIDPATAVGDPAGLGDSDIQSNDGLSILLIRNYKALDGPKGTDIDKDPLPFVAVPANAISTGNGTIDWKQTTPPPPAGAVGKLWEDADVVDSVGTNDYKDTDNPIDNGAYGVRGSYTVATLNTFWGASSTLGPRDPDTFARLLGNDTANSAAAYYGAKMNDVSPSPTDVLYRTEGTKPRYFGPGSPQMKGQVTPGRPNLATSLTPTDFRINEVGLNPPGSGSNRFQYVEIINTNGQSRSLSDHYLLVIDSHEGVVGDTQDPPGVGTIVEEWNLADFATGPNGLLLLGDGYSPSYTPFQDAVAPQTNVGDPSSNATTQATSWGSGDLRNKEGCTLLLVLGYKPSTVAAKDIDTNNDGIREGTLGSTAVVVDSIGFTQAGKTTSGRTYATVDLRTVLPVLPVPADANPQNFGRKAGDLSLNASAWYGGRYPSGTGTSPMYISYEDVIPANWFGGFRGAGTPGRPNLFAAIDPTAPPIPASIRINEVMMDPTDKSAALGDANHEYIELASTNEGQAYLDGLYILVVNRSGNIETGSPLNGFTTGTNGLAVLGDGYDGAVSPYTADSLPTGTAAFDPEAGLGGNKLPDDGIAILLVRGVKGPIIVDASGKPSGDLDPENDGIFLTPSAYTDELVDSIVVNTVNPGPGYGWIDSTSLLPGHIARYPGNLTNSNGSSWYGGTVAQGPFAGLPPPPPSTTYIGASLGSFRGAGSPGRANHSATPGDVNVGSVILNEISINPAGADNNFEFIELSATGGTSLSLNGYSILAVDNRISNTGSIRNVWNLDGMSTGTNGLFLMGNRYPVAGGNRWAPVMRPQTRTGDPAGREGLASGLSDNMIGNDTDNENITLLLVRDLSGYLGDDLDETTPNPPGLPIDSPGDGGFDDFPWTAIHDSVVLRSYVPTVPAGTGPTYPWDGWTYSLPDLSSTFFPVPSVTTFYHPDTISRFLGENTVNDTNSWYGGELSGGPDGKDGAAEAYSTVIPPVPTGLGFRGYLTPGQPNLTRSATGDPDQDGVQNLIEQAINTNPAGAASANPLPAPITITVGDQTYLGLSYPRIRTTAPTVPYAAEAYVYVVETSPDLITWTPDPGTGVGALVPVGTPAANPDGVTETAMVRLPDPVTTVPGRQFIRLRINRR